MHEDTMTTTLDGAAAYERFRSGDYGSPRDDLPSPAELAEQAEDDAYVAKRQQQRDDAARARGEYVPSTATRYAASTVAFLLATEGYHDAFVTPTREGVLWVNRVIDEEHLAKRLTPPEFIYQAVEGGVWVQVVTNYRGDPFLVDGVGNDGGPPF